MTDYQHVLAARLYICEAYFYGGPVAALDAVADASMQLAPLMTDEGGMLHCVVDALQEVSENIRLVSIFGQGLVQEAISCGPRMYAAEYSAADRRAA